MSLQENLANDALEALKMRDAVAIGPGDSVAQAVQAMQSAGEGCVVVTEHGKPIGIFTERDVLTKVLGGNASPESRIADVMTGPPSTIQAGCSVAKLVRTMHEGGFRHMPVVDESGFLKGVISVKRIVEYVVEHFPAAVFNLPPDPGQKSLAREGA